MLEHPLRGWLSPSPSPGDTVRVFARSIPLRRLEPRVPLAAWWHFDGAVMLGALSLTASMGSPILLEADEQGQHWMLLQHDGSANLKQGRKQHELHHGHGVLLPGLPWALHTNEASFTLLSFDPIELLAAARRLGGPHWQSPASRQSPLQALLPISSQGDGQATALLAMLNRLLVSAQELASLRLDLLNSLLLVDQLYRLLALLAFPELRIDNSPLKPLAGSSDPRLESILDFIDLNLHLHFSLQLLEERSNYSRRTLQNLFHQRFGCSPMQWIRQLRMARAYERLTQSIAGDTVKGVATECGYRSLSQFSIDFQRAHGCRPSDALRNGRPFDAS